MSVDLFYDLKEKNDSLLLAPLNFAVLGAKYGAAIPASLTGAGGNLAPFPDEWFSFGEIQKAAGVSMAPSLSVTGPEGYGSRGRRRDLVESEGHTVEFTAQETRLQTLDMAMDVDTTSFSVNTDNNDIRFSKRRTRRLPEYSMAFIGLDGDPDQEIYPYWIFPKMTNTNRAQLQMTETNIIEYALSMEMKEVPEHEPFYFGLAGPGAAAFATAMGIVLPTLPPVGG